VTVDPSQLPPAGEGEVYLFQLEGLEVKTDLGASLGRVKDVMTTGAAPILVVHDGARERLLPMSPDVLVGVDLEDKTIVVRMLPGLDEL
jgi:16S rRNA processing protein RimM